MTKAILARFVDITNRCIYPVEIIIEDGIISAVHKVEHAYENDLPYALPGFIDAHVHIESSMLLPSEFARLAVVHGTVGTVSDPHEIANVCGIEGIDYMIENGKTVSFKFNFGAPGCVPATHFETAGANLNVDDIAALLNRREIKYLAEMMNFPGVLNDDPEVLAKISEAHKAGKPVDGHAPGLKGEIAGKYIAAGITTDHGCFTYDEALSKLKQGMKILIREGSAAKNFEALIDLLNDYPNDIMFCSDDKHPDSLVVGHINNLCKRAVDKGIDVFNILQAACINPVKHYNLDIGTLNTGDPADFILVKNLQNFEVIQTYVDGQLVSENGKSNICSSSAAIINNFHCTEKLPSDFKHPVDKTNIISVIEALDGQLITKKLMVEMRVANGCVDADPDNDILKSFYSSHAVELPIQRKSPKFLKLS